MNLKKIVLVACLGASVVAGGLTGCNTSGRTTGQYIDDKKLAHDVRSALNSAPVYKYPEVDATAFNGTIQLNGFVATPDQKKEASEIAQAVPGVRQLVNNITVQRIPTPTGRDNPAPIYQNGQTVPTAPR